MVLDIALADRELPETLRDCAWFRDHTWFRPENEEKLVRHFKLLPDLVRRGWGPQIQKYGAVLREVLVLDVSQRAATRVAELIEH